MAVIAKTLSEVKQFAVDNFGSMASEFFNKAYRIPFTEAHVVVSAKDIVESGKYYPGDGEPFEVEKYGSHEAFMRTFECDKAVRITPEFEQSIVDNGIKFPITLCDVKQSDIDNGIVPRYFPTGIRVCDGHHRLYVAYENSLNVPVVFIDAKEINTKYHNSPDTRITNLPSANRP